MLKKLGTTQATVRDWKCLKKTVINLVRITELCGQQISVGDIGIILQLAECSTQELFSICDVIDRVFDLESSEIRGRFTVNSGIDEVIYNASYPLGDTSLELLRTAGVKLRQIDIGR